VEDRLIFLVSAPRSGSTLLERMLGAHSQIVGGPEPHLITPLAHLGYYERVDAAPYDPVITQRGLRELVERLPGGEGDWLDACRALTDHLYGRWLEAARAGSRLLDKTPAYALVLPFLVKLYPRASYVVLTRTPLAVLSSVVSSFFDGDYETAARHSQVLERYVPAIARFLREAQVPLLHVRYEPLVREPQPELERLLGFLGLDFEPQVIEYGSAAGADAPAPRGLGDPVGVSRHVRPVTSSIDRWAEELAGDERARAIALRSLDRLSDSDLETWGYPRAGILDALTKASPGAAVGRRRLSRYALERALLVRLRRNIHHNALGRLVRRVREVCDVLLR
jgi:hypothetical protein